MRIAIISDSHDNIPNLEKALQWINKEGIKTIIHCGDLCAPSILTEVILPNFNGEIHLVNGNVGDPQVLEKMCQNLKNVHIYNIVRAPMAIGARTKQSSHPAERGSNNSTGFGEIELDGKKIAFTHFPETAKQLAQTGQYDYVFYGHTHRPWLQETRIEADKNGLIRSNPLANQFISVYMVNPGTLAGMFYKATFAVLDTETGKLELKILEQIR